MRYAYPCVLTPEKDGGYSVADGQEMIAVPPVVAAKLAAYAAMSML